MLPLNSADYSPDIFPLAPTTLENRLLLAGPAEPGPWGPRPQRKGEPLALSRGRPSAGIIRGGQYVDNEGYYLVQRPASLKA